ncbi:MAG: hypothetical protein N2690_02220 [Rhodocyclaceae bacterium]|nr:hypothetical protein [Rhodocyclaceae bacterium]
MVDFTMAEGTGRDLIEAQRLSGGDANTLALALAARLVRVDGKPVLYEDFLEWPLADVMRAVAHVNRTLGNALSPAATA